MINVLRIGALASLVLACGLTAYAGDDDKKTGKTEKTNKTEKSEKTPKSGTESDKDKDKKKKPDPKKPVVRKVDTTSPAAKALASLLQVKPNYGDDKRVEITYNFAEASELEDFESRGFDRYQKEFGLELGVGSRGQGLLLHRLHLKGDYSVEIKGRIEYIAPSSSLVFVVGDGASGAIFGSALAKRSRKGYRVLSRKTKIDRRPFGAGRDATVKLQVEKGVLTTFVNGRAYGATKKLKKKLTGRPGIYMTNLRFIVTSITIKGEIDPAKL